MFTYSPELNVYRGRIQSNAKSSWLKLSNSKLRKTNYYLLLDNKWHKNSLIVRKDKFNSNLYLLQFND